MYIEVLALLAVSARGTRARLAPPVKRPWNNQRSCAHVFLRLPFPFLSLQPTPTTILSPTHIPWYLYHFHSLAGFCLSSSDGQTDGRSKAVCNCSAMSAAQGSTVLLRPYLRHRSSEASVVRRLSSAACTATPLFDVRSSGLSVASSAAWNSLPDYLRDPTHSVDSFHHDLKTFLFSFY